MSNVVPGIQRTVKERDELLQVNIGWGWFNPFISGVLLLVGSFETRGIFLACCVGAFAFLGGFVSVFYERHVTRKFIAWLLEHRTQVLSPQGATYRGQLISGRTPIVRYQVVVSCGLFAARHLTGVVPGAKAWPYSLATALFGWWQIPFGPFLAGGALIHNWRAESFTVLELLDVLLEPAVRTPWWRRLLALDSGNRAKIVGNVLAAILVVGISGLLLYTCVFINAAPRPKPTPAQTPSPAPT
jgi:hypothetical protein